jgi:homoserine O-acetyltransferase
VVISERKIPELEHEQRPATGKQTNQTQYFFHPGDFELEAGGRLTHLRIAYNCLGKLNERRDNVIWVCHAFTASSDVQSWWPGMVGPGLLIDTDRFFVVCANIIGSCYGTTGPLDVNPETGKIWYRDFPMITIRDVVNAHELLRIYLDVASIYLVLGGSIGAFQCLEWAIMYPDSIRKMVFISGNACASPWNIALNEAQRMAIMADPGYQEDKPEGGNQGMKAVRAMALISYRAYDAFDQRQKEDDPSKIAGYKAASYQQYQGEKFARRFNAYSYMTISRMFDSHHIGRGRASLEDTLASVRARSLVVAMNSDQLFPTKETSDMVRVIPDAQYVEIQTIFGHDGFLIEIQALTQCIGDFLTI